MVVSVTCAQRSAKPRVAKPATLSKPPSRYCATKVSIMPTCLPAEPACWICATITSRGTVAAALSVPPMVDAMSCWPYESFFFASSVGSPRRKSKSSAALLKAKRVPQSKTRLVAKVPAPFMRELTPSSRMTRPPTVKLFAMFSTKGSGCRKTGSVITRVFSSSVGDSTKPCTPPAPAPAIVSAVLRLTVPLSTTGYISLSMSALDSPNTPPLNTDCSVPHGMNPSNMPITPFLPMISWRMVESGAFDVCLHIFRNSRWWPHPASNTHVTPATTSVCRPGERQDSVSRTMAARGSNVVAR
mmetsp:Transcript_49480/g.114347  ORF Transcript_49480/g.114347 Transcript_49480/m.114347 type:complete len:300 (-) Transcript_49480:6-905(-)